MATVVVGLYSAFSVFFSRVGLVQYSPQWAERFISSHECWRWAFSPPPLTFIPSHPLLPSNFSFVSPPVSAFICCHGLPSQFPSDVGFRGSSRTWCKHTAFILLTSSPLCVCVSVFLMCVSVSSGCLGPLCTLSWSGQTATPPAWAKSGCRCCLFSGSWC